jgi:cytochrome c556
MSRISWPVVAVVLVLIAPAFFAIAQTGVKKRAKPPRFEDAEFDGTFFKNVFDHTVGKRPRNLAAAPPQQGNGNSNGNGGTNEATAPTAKGAWTQWISATSLEDEIKSLKLQTDKDVTTPTKFRSGGYKECRKSFSVAAMVFAIINEYDSDVRWKKESPGARDLFARAAGNCKVGSTQAFMEAKNRKADLQDLIGGGSFADESQDPSTQWHNICDRSPLMQRLETAVNKKLKPWTANKGDFNANIEAVFHEAEMVALIGEVLTKEGMENGDDEDYAAFSITMRDAARKIIDACKDKDAAAASKAVGTITQSCSECHENYRG